MLKINKDRNKKNCNWIKHKLKPTSDGALYINNKITLRQRLYQLHKKLPFLTEGQYDHNEAQTLNM